MRRTYCNTMNMFEFGTGKIKEILGKGKAQLFGFCGL